MKPQNLFFGISLSALAMMPFVAGAADPPPAAVLIQGPAARVTTTDIEAVLFAAPADTRGMIKRDRQRLRQVIDTTYLTNAAAADARKNGLDQDPITAARVERAIANVLAEAQVRQVIEHAGKPDFEQAARESYTARKAEFLSPEQIEASHILIKTEGRSKEEALTLANQILERLNAGEASFEELAREHSEDQGSAEKGGSLDRFGRRQMVKPFEKAAFALTEVGEVTGPVESRFGYHIIRLDAKAERKPRPFEKVRQSIIDKLTRNYRKSIREEYFISLRDDPRIQVKKEVMDAFLSEAASGNR